MDRLDERLRRTGELVSPPEPALERLVLRRDRLRRNRRIASTILALTVAAGGIGGAVYGMSALVDRRPTPPVVPAAPTDAHPPPPLETGEYFYEKTTLLLPHAYGLGGGRVIEETWWGPDGSGRREAESTTPDYGLGPIGSWGPGRMPVEDFLGLSTDPDVLTQQLLERSSAGGASPQPPGTPGPGVSVDSATLWRAISHLLEKPNAEPALRAALFEVAASIPEVEVLPNTEDPVGRSAIALRMAAGDGVFHLYFDPDTLQLLAGEERYDGGATFYRIVQSAGVVASTEDIPEEDERLVPTLAGPLPEA
jgi:hypothetical protein